LLVLENVFYGYPGGAAAVRGLTLAIARGEWVALMGANGCGKSTVARLACGLIEPDAGKVARPRVGYVAQDPEANIVGETVLEDVAWNVAPRGEQAALGRVAESLALVGLSGYEGRSMWSLSGGELQRTAVAAALAQGAEALVLDEPTSHLAGPDGQEFCKRLKAIVTSRKLAVLYVTHRPEEARFADRVVVLAHGRIALEARPAGALFRRALLGMLGLRADLAISAKRVLDQRRRAANRAAGEDVFERLVERTCSGLIE